MRRSTPVRYDSAIALCRTMYWNVPESASDTSLLCSLHGAIGRLAAASTPPPTAAEEQAASKLNACAADLERWASGPRLESNPPSLGPAQS